KSRLAGALNLAPATGAIVGDHGFDEIHQRTLVDRLALADLYRARSQVPLSLIDDAFRIGRNGIVDEDVDVVFGCLERADVAIQREVRSVRALDRLDDVRIGGVDEVAHATADVLLPGEK